MASRAPSVQDWLDEIKSTSNSSEIGIFFIHNGVVRGTTREGLPVASLELSYDHKRLQELIAEAEAMPGVVAARAWVNEGTLSVGDDLIYALVAGDVRKNVFDSWQTLVRRVRTEGIRQHENVHKTAGQGGPAII